MSLGQEPIAGCSSLCHPGGNPGANLKSMSLRCHPILVAFVWELTKETIHLPLGCPQGGSRQVRGGRGHRAETTRMVDHVGRTGLSVGANQQCGPTEGGRVLCQSKLPTAGIRRTKDLVAGRMHSAG